ncbi:Vitamin B12 transport ATP-binding protein BacA [Aquicella siphonis]|uniref:Vitamin B12 transport ATP-binding protein BacA n=1 Tax=Aquicella siphonis TaxID=254247 RepID=A0A5E4PEV7_9COXI|nr:ABC transporter ATP-binding protein/permease [Aquicella siphonis]VVC74891.1 Vitamin B12 transport ATP-binding protein BacA [Aquicella siphonis]
MELFSEKGSPLMLESRHYTTWELIKAYWHSQYKLSAYLFFTIIIFLTIVLVGFDVVFNYWYNYFYDALQAYNMHAAVRLLVFFFILAAFNIVVAVYRYYLSQIFALRWRRWLTEQMIGRWLEKRGYYYLETFDVKTDNPDQRIQDDVNGLISNSISLTVGLVGAVTTFPAFIYILWTLSGVLSIPLGSLGTIHIHGYLVWVGLLYNLIGTLLTFKIGYPLVGLNFEQQQREATFRFSAIDLRSHAEQVALYRGEDHQKSILNFHFFRVLENWYAIILRQKLLLWFTGGFNQAAVLLPLIVALPNYFTKVFLLGGLMQSLRAFGNVQESLSYLVNSYTQIAEWRAISQRLTTFVNHLKEAEMNAEQADHVVFRERPENAIKVKDLTIKTTHDNTLLTAIDENFVHGTNYVIKGESGIGKSTFIRAIAGVWPFASGEVTFPENKRVMYLPQKPYMPIGTLAEAILFPDKKDPELEKNIETVLHDCHLDGLIPRLSEVAHWSEQLSPGEQQRVAFARVLLHKPDWVFLDESTSMLDLANEAHLYKILRERLPDCSVVSVGHHPSVDAFHDQVVNMSKYRHVTRVTA